MNTDEAHRLLFPLARSHFHGLDCITTVAVIMIREQARLIAAPNELAYLRARRDGARFPLNRAQRMAVFALAERGCRRIFDREGKRRPRQTITP